MSNYDPKRIVQNFAERSLRNLAFIEFHEHSENADVYEVTQLINSLLGLIVFPKEKFLNRLPPTPLADLVNLGWPSLHFSIDQVNCKTLPQLIENMRHGVSHSNIRFLVDENNELSGVVLWNCLWRTTEKIWEVQMNTVDLRKFVTLFNQLLQDIPEDVATQMVAQG